ncbi:hypothetical protein MTR67_025602 [Solanum verrucosum]|uniref:DUF4283 domain-containing protein n=1 Tax=Solanum verrucosum TaxID=315347 RepID=A0AAF0QXG0_SOLVR|nr:hypothetical protein MTR67_025602 [Solanum verrucosum]
MKLRSHRARMARGRPKRDGKKMTTTKTHIAQQSSISGTIHTDARGSKTPGTVTINPPSQKEMTQVEGKHTPQDRIVEPVVAASTKKGAMTEDIHKANLVETMSTHGNQGRDFREVHRKLNMPTDTVTEKPFSLFEGNTMASKGMDLQFIPPMVKDGVKIGKLNEDEVAKEAAMWKNVIILYVIGNSPTIAAVTSEVINYKPVIVKPWTTNFNFKDEVLKVIPLWVKFPNLPLNCWGTKSLSRITSVLGKPICAN